MSDIWFDISGLGEDYRAGNQLNLTASERPVSVNFLIKNNIKPSRSSRP
jgi:hypothetical protein